MLVFMLRVIESQLKQILISSKTNCLHFDLNIIFFTKLSLDS